MKVQTDIFIMGLVLGWGPCLSFCAPILIPYIAGIHKGWKEGLKATLIFSFARIIPYIILSIIAASLGSVLIGRYYESTLAKNIFLIIASFIILLGILLIIGRFPKLSYCDRFLQREITGKMKGLVLLGVLIGFSPCIPLFGVLAYIAFVSKSVLHGLFLGSCFALGTLLSPLILLGTLAGGLPTFILRKAIISKIFNIICGISLIYFGVKILIQLGYL